MDRLLEIGRSLADTEVTAYLLQQDFVLYGLIAIALLGLLAGAEAVALLYLSVFIKTGASV